MKAGERQRNGLAECQLAYGAYYVVALALALQVLVVISYYVKP